MQNPRNSDVTLWVMDNGKGFDVETGKSGGGLGLITMRERADQFGGTVSFQSDVDGTIVTARLKAYKKGELDES